MSSVSCAESVVYEDVSVGSKSLCKICAVLGLTSIESGVLKKNCMAGLESSNLSLRVLTYEVLSEGYKLCTEELVESCANGLKGELLLIGYESLCKELCGCSCLLLCGKCFNSLLLLLVKAEALGENAVGLTHMRAKNNLCAIVEKVLNGRKCANDSLIRGDNAVLHRYVKVAANKDCFATYFNVFNCFLVVSCHFR